MTWINRAECPECDDEPHFREIELEHVATAANGVTVHHVLCADCGRTIREMMGYSRRDDRISVDQISCLDSEEVVTPDDVTYSQE